MLLCDFSVLYLKIFQLLVSSFVFVIFRHVENLVLFQENHGEALEQLLQSFAELCPVIVDLIENFYASMVHEIDFFSNLLVQRIIHETVLNRRAHEKLKVLEPVDLAMGHVSSSDVIVDLIDV